MFCGLLGMRTYYIIVTSSSVIWAWVIFAFCDDKLMVGGCSCSKHFRILPAVFRLLCLFYLNGPFFVLQTCEVFIYKFTLISLQVEEDSRVLGVHRSWVPMKLLNGWDGGRTVGI